MQFSPRERKLLELLQDGNNHLKIECARLINASDDTRLHNCIGRIRAKIRSQGYDVVCTIDRRRAAFRLVRSLPEE